MLLFNQDKWFAFFKLNTSQADTQTNAEVSYH